MDDHRRRRAAHILLRVALAKLRRVAQGQSLRDVAIQRIVGAGLIRHHIHLHAAAHDLWKNIRAVADKTDRKRAAFAASRVAEGQCFLQIFCDRVAIARVNATLNTRAIDIDGENHPAVQGDRQGLRSAHPAHASGDHKLALQGSRFAGMGKVLVGECGKGLKRALQNALRPNVDPASSRHLAVHHQAFAVEFLKVFPVRPFPHQI